MVPCPYCGIDIDDGARFCGACGRPITPTAASQRAAAAAAAKAKANAETLQDDRGGAASAAAAAVSASLSVPPPPKSSPSSETIRTPTVPPTSGKPIIAAQPVNGPMPEKRPPIRAAAQPLESLIGRTLNHRYLIEDKIGEGGFGAVFRGKQIATGREVALKILHPHNVSDQTIVARFRREAEACSKLRDPHTVTTYDFDETPDGILYLAMELLRGHSLHGLQRTQGPLAGARVLRIMDQVAASLSEAHAAGIVHRDMKPENVFIENRGGNDHVKVLDFGIAKVMSDEHPVPALTAVGQTLGTLEFMSPEQLRGQALDGRSDIYALGMMAYEMLTGVLPFGSVKNPIDIINFHMKTPPPPPSQLSNKVVVPPAVDAVILKMVQKDRDQRFADANALREAIARALSALDRAPDRFEAYRVVGVIGATVALLALILFLLHR